MTAMETATEMTAANLPVMKMTTKFEVEAGFEILLDHGPYLSRIHARDSEMIGHIFSFCVFLC